MNGIKGEAKGRTPRDFVSRVCTFQTRKRQPFFLLSAVFIFLISCQCAFFELEENGSGSGERRKINKQTTTQREERYCCGAFSLLAGENDSRPVLSDEAGKTLRDAVRLFHISPCHKLLWAPHSPLRRFRLASKPHSRMFSLSLLKMIPKDNVVVVRW